MCGSCDTSAHDRKLWLKFISLTPRVVEDFLVLIKTVDPGPGLQSTLRLKSKFDYWLIASFRFISTCNFTQV